MNEPVAWLISVEPYCDYGADRFLSFVRGCGLPKDKVTYEPLYKDADLRELQLRAEKAEAELARHKAALAYAMNHHSRDMDYFDHVLKILAADELYGTGLEPDQTEQIRKNQEMRARLDQLPIATGPKAELARCKAALEQAQKELAELHIEYDELERCFDQR